MPSQMKTIRSYGNVAEAGFAQSLLQAAGIDAFIPHEFAATSSPEFAIWQIRLQAPDEDVERAAEIPDGQAGLNPQPPGVSLDESAPVQLEVKPPSAKEYFRALKPMLVIERDRRLSLAGAGRKDTVSCPRLGLPPSSNAF